MNKRIGISLFIFLTVICLVSLGFNIYYIATKPLSAGGVFSLTKDSVVEVKAEKEGVGVSYGSGVIVSDDGLLVTNAHVVTYKELGESNSFEKVSVRLIDEQDFREVTVVKYDLDLDIAVLQLSCEREIKSIKIGDDEKVYYGDTVYAIGNMSNYGLSLTTGYVAIPHINVTYNGKTRNVIQCDLTISDGNSGGALINEKGELVGITTFRLKDQSNNVIYGIAYCIPINTVMEYIKNN